MRPAGSVLSPPPVVHFEQYATLDSKIAPHTEHFLAGDAGSTSHGSAGVFAKGGISGAGGIPTARNRGFLGLSCRTIDHPVAAGASCQFVS